MQVEFVDFKAKIEFVSPEEVPGRNVENQKKQEYKDLTRHSVIEILHYLGIVLEDRPGREILVESPEGDITYFTYFMGIHPWVSRDDLANELKEVSAEAENFMILKKALASDNSPFRNVSMEELVILLNRGGEGEQWRFWKICADQGIPVVDSPNNPTIPSDEKERIGVYDDLVKFNRKDKNSAPTIEVGPFPKFINSTT